MNKKNFIELVLLGELYKIKMHICNQRYFEAGFGLGGLINQLSHQKDEDEQEDEEEEGNSEDNYFLQYVEEKEKRELLERKIEELSKDKEKLEKTNKTIESTKKCIFELQDLIMRLIKFKKIDKSEIANILNILRYTGVEDCDIKVLCHLEEPKKKRK